MHFHRHQNTRPPNKHGYNEVCQSHPQSRVLWTLSDPAFTVKNLEWPLWCPCQGHNFQQHQFQDTNHQRHRIVSRYLVTIAPRVMLYDGIITLDRYKIALSYPVIVFRDELFRWQGGTHSTALEPWDWWPQDIQHLRDRQDSASPVGFKVGSCLSVNISDYLIIS